MRNQHKLLVDDEKVARELKGLGFTNHIINIVIGEKEKPEAKN